MTKILYLNPRMLIADEGKKLTNGEVTTTVVYLGDDEQVENWQEVDESGVETDAE
ncbi:MAG: hypothetical protein Q4D64_15325 [Prevotellaceae bacterium]|nr:hypothetical protein [Prevotellaceae bacterium]